MAQESAADRPKKVPNPEYHWDSSQDTAGEAASRKHDIGFVKDQGRADSILVDSRLHEENVMAGPCHRNQKRG